MTKKDLQKVLKEFLLKSKSSLITEETLTQAQLDKRQDYLKDLMKQKLAGSQNAGEMVFLGGDFDWKQLSLSIKDMDFPQLKKSVTESIYNALKIPLPMISSENMTFSNMDASKYAYYDNAVIPVLKRLLKFLSCLYIWGFT